jgi:hypothetical protein
VRAPQTDCDLIPMQTGPVSKARPTAASAAAAAKFFGVWSSSVLYGHTWLWSLRQASFFPVSPPITFRLASCRSPLRIARFFLPMLIRSRALNRPK